MNRRKVLQFLILIASATLWLGSGLSQAIAPGHLVIANDKILDLDPATSGFNVIAESSAFDTASLFFDARGLRLDSNGQILIADGQNGGAPGRVVRIDPPTGQQTLISSGGLLTRPQDLEIRSDGMLVVSNADTPNLILVDPLTGSQQLLLQGGDLGDFIIGMAQNPAGDLAVLAGSSSGWNIVEVNAFTGASQILFAVSSNSRAPAFTLAGDLVLPRLSGANTVVEILDPILGTVFNSFPSFPGLARGTTVGSSGDIFLTTVIPTRVVQVDGSTGVMTVLLEDDGSLATLFNVFALVEAGPSSSNTLVVNTADDVDDGACTLSHCSLREALLASNTQSGTQQIRFDIAPGGAQTIQPLSNLPIISDAVTIDGTTQPGFAGAPLIELDGSQTTAHGLRLQLDGCTIKGLVINQFPAHGIRLENSSNHTIEGCYIGTDLSGSTALPNGGDGIEIFGGGGHRIGGVLSSARNLISGNTGVGIDDASTTNTGSNLIQGNYIGTDVTGTLPLGNSIGIILRSPQNGVGGTSPGAGNLVSGNATHGISIGGSTAISNAIEGNQIGTDYTGTVAVGNGADGVSIGFDAADNTVGGTDPGAGNLISGNGSDGIQLFSNSRATTIQRNLIGTASGGTSALANLNSGIAILNSTGNTIGGASSAERNVVSGNANTGIGIDGGSDNVVRGNVVGTDVTGSVALGNGGDGIVINRGPSNTIGGSGPGAGNVVSGNGAVGIRVGFAESTGNVIQGNLVGTDANGVAGLGNAAEGIRIGAASGNQIGGTLPGEGNVVSANRDGIVLVGVAENNVIEGNLIGTQSDALSPLGNTRWGVGHLVPSPSTGNVLGGTAPGAGNTIAYNGEYGVLIGFTVESIGFAVLGNSIHDNGLLGIDLSPATGAVNPNDPDDADTGTNRLQNFPVIASATRGTTDLTVAGSVDSEPLQNFRLEFFAGTACDASSHGEGETFLGSVDVSTDAGGDASFSATFATLASGAGFVTATATHPDGSTSEFSACVAIDADSDGDGVPDGDDGCPLDPAKSGPGVCGCGVPDTDSDDDGTPDCVDGCPVDPAKADPGICGCGVADTDSDGDGTADCNDSCATDPAKIDPGTCGCGVADVDSDGDGFLLCQECNDNDPLINPDAAEVCDGIDNDCNGMTDDNATLSVTASNHQVGTGTYPGSTKTPLVGLLVGVYDKAEGSCARDVCGGVSWQQYDCIFQSCATVAQGLTDTAGGVDFTLTPGDYLVIGGDGTDKHLGVSASDLQCGQLMQKHLQQLETANGKKHPGKTTRRTGSELLIIEPEFMEWSAEEELYPFVLESLGQWTATTAVLPPEGFAADYEELSAEVVNQSQALQFTVTDVGSDWVPTEVTHRIEHDGRREVILTRVGLLMSEELAQQKALDRFGRPRGNADLPPTPRGPDPRAPRNAEITGWVEPSFKDPQWTLNLHVDQDGQVFVALTRGQGRVIRILINGHLEPGDYQLPLAGLDYDQLRLKGNYFLTLISGETVQTVKLKR